MCIIEKGLISLICKAPNINNKIPEPTRKKEKDSSQKKESISCF